MNKPIIKLEKNGSGGLVINKLPTSQAMKRVNSSSDGFNPNKFAALQTISDGTSSLTSYQWEQSVTSPNKKQIGAAISSLPPNTIIQAKSSAPTGFSALTAAAASQSSTMQIRRPTIYIKRESVTPKRTIRQVSLELIQKNPMVHLGVNSSRLPLLKNTICNTAGVSQLDCYITLKKMRQNEDFALLAEYFEMTESEVQQIFARTVSKLARFMRYLIRWPDSKKYYDRHKNLPFAFRSKLSHVQSLIECVETDMQCPMQTDCSNYKFILSITPNNIISYISDAFVGHHDDLTIFSASDFQNCVPKYLSLVADPGKAIRRTHLSKDSNQIGDTDSTTDSADESGDEGLITAETDDNRVSMSRYAAQRVAAELASEQTLSVVNKELKSRKVKDFSIPTMRVKEPVCRQQIRQMIDKLREFKILQPLAIQEQMLLQYLNESLIVIAALINLQR